MHDSSNSRMKVVLVHYHLADGGVSRVIGMSSAGLSAQNVPHIVLCGAPPPPSVSLPVRVVAGLGYAAGPEAVPPAVLAERMLEAARDALGNGPHIWHFHNHSLGKNPSLPAAVALLANHGERMVLQIHDLAEDGRPENFPAVAGTDALYPLAPHIFYAFINRRDHGRFRQAGLPDAQSAYLPDPVAAPVRPAHGTAPSSAPLVLYASRGIRRKNPGEIFLLAALSPAGCRYATTLPPGNSPWLPHFHNWKSFGKSHGLPVELGVVGHIPPAPGDDTSLETWHDRSTHYLTTSVAEGFGLGFLEPVALGKPLFGRNLPDITIDFTAAGIRPGDLYDHLLVPVSWPGARNLRKRIHLSCSTWMAGYGRAATQDFTDRACAALLDGTHVDFGNLPEDMQKDCIIRVMEGSGDDILVAVGDRTSSAREWLAGVLTNRRASCPSDALAPFSIARHTERLAALYSRALAATPAAVQALDPARVLDQYSHPEAFHFLRCGATPASSAFFECISDGSGV